MPFYERPASAEKLFNEIERARETDRPLSIPYGDVGAGPIRASRAWTTLAADRALVCLVTDVAGTAGEARQAGINNRSWTARLTGSTALGTDHVLADAPRRSAIDTVVTTR